MQALNLPSHSLSALWPSMVEAVNGLVVPFFTTFSVPLLVFSVLGGWMVVLLIDWVRKG